MVGRRTVLSGAALLPLAACGSQPPAAAVPVPPGVRIERRTSTARHRDVDVVTMRPDGATSELPLCLVLHGRGGSARGMIELGVPTFLRSASFAAVAIDCGDAYFTAHPDDDALRMLLDELPGWTGRAPDAVLGISMGGFGALRLARVRTDLRAVALLSPALFLSWPDARARRAFAGEAEWQADEPLRHLADVEGTPVGLDRRGRPVRRSGAAARGAGPAGSGGDHPRRARRRVLARGPAGCTRVHRSASSIN